MIIEFFYLSIKKIEFICEFKFTLQNNRSHLKIYAIHRPVDQTQSATREFARVFQIISVIHIRTVVQNAL